MYKKTGTIQYFSDLTLKDAEWRINAVVYDWENASASVEIYLSDDAWVQTHSRTYNFPVPGEWTSANVIDAVLNLDPFQNSELV
jgi:hypothetical protein